MKKTGEIFLVFFLIATLNLLVVFYFYPIFYEKWHFICPLDESMVCPIFGLLLRFALPIVQFVVSLLILLIAIDYPKRRTIMIMIIVTLISLLIFLITYLKYFF